MTSEASTSGSPTPEVEGQPDSVLTLAELRAEVEALLGSAAEGAALDSFTVAFVALAVQATPTILHGPGVSEYAEAALDAGATPAQVQEAITFVSGIGLHTLIEATRRLGEILSARADPIVTEPLDERRRALLAASVGEELPAFELAVPGFFENLARLSPAAFQGFFDYRSIPWQNPQLDPLTKELMAIAVDAVPTHRFLPTLRLHVAKALELGAGRRQITQALDIAAAAPEHPGVR
jgi:alkylhydroperoxidase/carboxymuconolactone decarboxylase family protein YurZ